MKDSLLVGQRLHKSWRLLLFRHTLWFMSGWNFGGTAVGGRGTLRIIVRHFINLCSFLLVLLQ